MTRRNSITRILGRPQLLRMLLVTLMLAAFPTQAQPAIGVDDSPRWWKGNLHTHSLWSDGDDFPEMIACWYRDDYQGNKTRAPPGRAWVCVRARFLSPDSILRALRSGTSTPPPAWDLSTLASMPPHGRSPFRSNRKQANPTLPDSSARAAA